MVEVKHENPGKDALRGIHIIKCERYKTGSISLNNRHELTHSLKQYIRSAFIAW